jgi:hypothetical protein
MVMQMHAFADANGMYLTTTVNNKKKEKEAAITFGQDVKVFAGLNGAQRSGPVRLDTNLTALSGVLRMEGYPRRRSPPPT